MSKKAKWTLKGTILYVNIEGTEAMFDLERLYPNFSQMDTIPKNLFVYGAKQFLSDKTAREKDVVLTPAEKVKVMKDRYQMLIDGQWSMKPEKGTIISKKKLEKEAEEKLSEKEQQQLKKLMKKMGLE